MIEETQTLLRLIFSAIHRKAPRVWRGLELVVLGTGSSTHFTTHATLTDGSDDSFDLESTTASACSKLRRTMFQPGKGTWYSAHFTINSAGECDVYYDYESIPLDPDFDETLEDIRDSLIEDQELFPRDQEFLPEWHPCRAKP
jgi:hypothetical protein